LNPANQDFERIPQKNRIGTATPTQHRFEGSYFCKLFNLLAIVGAEGRIKDKYLNALIKTDLTRQTFVPHRRTLSHLDFFCH